MAVIAAMAVMAGILDAEELQALIIFLAPSRDRGEFIAAPAFEGGSRTTLFRGASAIPPATPATALAGATRSRTFAAALGRGCGATAIPAPALTAAAATTTPSTARFGGIAIVRFGRA